MTERVEQRICTKFCQKLGHTCSETIRTIRKVYGDDSMSDTQIKERKKERKKKCSPFPSTAKVLSTMNAPQDRTINKEYCLKVLKRLRDAVRRKRPHLCGSDNLVAAP